MSKWRWGVILDAGSSGTRVYVYRWLNPLRARHEARGAELYRLPNVQTKSDYTMKINPGVSTFADSPLDVGPKHLQRLLDHALDIVPESQVADTPIFLMATAGVRLLEQSKQKALLAEICAYAQLHTHFSLPDCGLHIQVIPGETEGLYGWVAVNYLMKSFDTPQQLDEPNQKSHHTYGLLEMGGASAQIAFAPNTTETVKHANDLKLLRLRTLNGEQSEYKIFTATWLGFGVNQARERYVASLMDASYTKDAHEILDPCLPSGLKTTLDGKTDSHESIMLLGTGLFDECLRKTYPLLDKDAPCVNQPCLLHGQHVPTIDWSVNHFVGVSEYWHTTHGVFDMRQNKDNSDNINTNYNNNNDNDNKYDFATYKSKVKDFCSKGWDDIQHNAEKEAWGTNVDVKVAQEVCFKASWLINVLHEGIGIPRMGNEKNMPNSNPTVNKSAEDSAPYRTLLAPFQAVNKIGNLEVSWTLGKMVLYAAGQIPPPSGSQDPPAPVGFGPNLGGPETFQEAGSNFNLIPSSDDENTWTEAAEELAEKAHHYPTTHGLLIFVIILIIIGYLFRKRDPRLRLCRLLRRNRRPGSSRWAGAGRSFFYSGGSYFASRGPTTHSDKALDGGEAAAGFELVEADSDDNDYSDSSVGSRLGRASGLATPKLNSVTVDSVNPYFDGANGNPNEGIGLGVMGTPNANAFHRAGLVVRTESRDRSSLGLSHGGSRQL